MPCICGPVHPHSAATRPAFPARTCITKSSAAPPAREAPLATHKPRTLPAPAAVPRSPAQALRLAYVAGKASDAYGVGCCPPLPSPGPAPGPCCRQWLGRCRRRPLRPAPQPRPRAWPMLPARPLRPPASAAAPRSPAFRRVLPPPAPCPPPGRPLRTAFQPAPRRPQARPAPAPAAAPNRPPPPRSGTLSPRASPPGA